MFKQDEGYIYLIKCREFHKIGKTKDINSRLLAFSVKMPFKFELIDSWYVKDMHYCEKQLHSLFNENHVNGEWFELDEDECLDKIKETLKLWITEF